MFPELTIISDLTTSDPRLHPDKILKNSQKWFDDQGNALAYGFYDRGYNYLYITNTALFQFSEAENDVVAFAFEHTSQEIIYDTYYRNALPLILQAKGKEVIHASAVINGDQISIFCANSGAGKSTMAYGLYQRGYELSADDAVAIETIRNTVMAVPLPFRTRLLPDSREYFSKLKNRSEDNLSEINRSFQVREKFPLKSICILNKILPSDNADHGISIKRVNRANGFSALLSHAYVFHLNDTKTKRKMIENFLDIADLTPIYRIEYPHNFVYFSDLLDQIELII